ncbi:SUMF1/EgtB/PvdO family nonheme iron enzyme [candidate division KSB1 bacterium]|nr:SUMF1/EgtB/PvdO family nonheme iron enzyme [candidate division KSB1 bacterium]
MENLAITTIICCFLIFFSIASSIDAREMTSNSAGIKLVDIKPGTFTMGSNKGRDFWDEQPPHQVTISKAFRISETEITIEQFRQFDPEYTGDPRFAPHASGISWYEAVAFCQWLSEQTGQPYRLPTEAEWEYVARAGTSTPYSSGETPPAPETANAWGVKNMHTGVREWCSDWYGSYPDGAVKDPVGPESGLTKVVRGGSLDGHDRLADRKQFDAASNRASIAPGFGLYREIKEAPAAVESQESQTTPGLIGVWFGFADFERPQDVEVIARLDNNWVNDINRGKDWSGRWRGFITVPISGEIEFELKVATGGILRIDGNEIINQWTQPGVGTGKMMMENGQAYPIEVLYTHHSGGETYLRLSWNYAGMPTQVIPASAIFHTPGDRQIASAELTEEGERPGKHWIGFRVVQAPPVQKTDLAEVIPFARLGVRKNYGLEKIGPVADKPYFRKRYLLPTPFDNSENREIDAVDLHPSFRGHNHSPALAVCPNGDVLLITYTSYHEYEPGVSLAGCRLRFGGDQWDMPSPMVDFATANDHAPLLWTEQNRLFFFWGCPRLDGGFPFHWTTSTDNGATWTEIRFPRFVNKIGPHSRQPINTALRDKHGTLFIASDGSGGTSLLWATADDGDAWYDTGGRSAGRHTSYALLSDGETILGLGGKNTDIEGYMPKAISRDGGKSWTVEKTPFAALGTNQRPSLLRLASGRLFFAGDFQHFRGHKPEAIQQNGSYVALSDDDGASWTIRELIGTQQHENPKHHKGYPTLGYSAARQAPNGMIHLITTMNRPCLHFEFNEAWILQNGTPEKVTDAQLMQSTATAIRSVKKYTEYYADGKEKFVYHGGVADDGRFLLHGAETWFYSDGQKQREANYELGHKIGAETFWSAKGSVEWTWQHAADGTSRLTRYWHNGQKRSESTWKNHKCEGVATRWDSDGKVISRENFVDGVIQ